MKKVYFPILYFLAQINLSCYHSKDFTGIYVACHPFGKDTLSLYNNGIFKQNYKDKSGMSYTNMGTWKYRTDKIEFDDYVWFLPGYGPKNKAKVFWIGKVNYTIMGNPYIIIDDDLEYSYKKLSH